MSLPCQCSCSSKGSAQLLSFPFDKDVWNQTVKDYHHGPDTSGNPSNNNADVNAAAGDDVSSIESAVHDESCPVFIELVTKRRPIVPRWLYRLCHGGKALEDDDNYAFSVNLADMQRMHLRLMQGRLTWLALSAGFDADRGASQGVLTELGPTLRDYVQAVRDHEYMGRFSGQRHDPFRVSSERDQEKWVLDELMFHKLKDIRHFRWLKPTARATGRWEMDREGPMRPIGGTRGEAFRRALWSRAAGALVGAAFLIGPMWPLVLKQDIYLQLGVTTGCIVAFGLVMVVALDTLEAVFAATLAYAAVLMVFVGVVMESLGDNS